MSRRRRVRLEFEELLVYPLLDLDGSTYTGPEGMHLDSRLDKRLRDVQTRWQELRYVKGGDRDYAALAAETEEVERELALALEGTGWVLVKRGERTEEQRRRRRKSKRR